MKKILFTLLLFTQFFALSQQRVGSGFSVIYGKQRLDLTKSIDEEGEEVEGKPFVVETFLPANVKGYDGTFLLRYNAYKDEMEFEKDNDIHYLVKTDSSEVYFLNSKKRYKFLEHKFNDEITNGYLAVISENEKISLYKKERIKLIPKVYAANSYKSDVPAHFEIQKDAFFIKKENSIIAFPNSKKELIRMFPDKEKQIVDFLKTNGLSFSKESDLITIVTFLNTI